MNEPRDFQAPNQMRREIMNVIRRYGQESGVTVYEALGALDMAKDELVEMLKTAQSE